MSEIFNEWLRTQWPEYETENEVEWWDHGPGFDYLNGDPGDCEFVRLAHDAAKSVLKTPLFSGGHYPTSNAPNLCKTVVSAGSSIPVAGAGMILKISRLIRYLYSRAVRMYYNVREWLTGKRSFEE